MVALLYTWEMRKDGTTENKKNVNLLLMRINQFANKESAFSLLNILILYMNIQYCINIKSVIVFHDSHKEKTLNRIFVEVVHFNKFILLTTNNTSSSSIFFFSCADQCVNERKI